MAKDKGTDDILKELGIDPSQPEQAVETLRALRASGAAGESKIAAAAGQIFSSGAAQILLEMEPRATGALRREIRRALFKLRQHGIESASPAPPPPAAAAAAQSNINTNINALISPVDPDGSKLVWIFKPRSQGGISRLQGLSSEAEGLIGANLTHISRRELREERRELERRFSVKLVDADYRLADFMLCEAYRRTPQARLGEVGKFLAVRAEILTSAPPADYPHPIYDEFADSIAQEPSVELLSEPALGGWIIAQPDLKPYLDEIEGIRQSPLVLNQYQQEERVNAVVARAVEELLSGEPATLMRRRLEDSAYYLARSGNVNAARGAASAAARIRDGAPLGRIAFFVQYVMRSMGLVLNEQQEEAAQQPRLIMTPAEAMRAQAAARARQRR